MWNQLKKLTLGLCAIDSIAYANRLAQTIFIEDSTYDIGMVFCYLYKAVGNASYNIDLSIYDCDDDGTPLNLIDFKTLDVANVVTDGWYSFSFNLSGNTPSNGFLSFVLCQYGGNENNYVLWGYSQLDESKNPNAKAWTSDDGSTWVQQNNAIRAMKITGDYNPYNLIDFQIESPPAENKTRQGSLETVYSEFDGTKIEDNKVVLDYKNLIASFVVDSSGSMGWNDRLGNRKYLLQQLISSFDQYPSDVIFDIIKFGGIDIGSESAISDIGQSFPIILDINVPTNTTYIFTTESATVSIDAIYTDGTNQFTVVGGGTTVSVVVANGSTNPIYGNGILEKTSGTGDDSIRYLSYAIASINDGIVAYGFKNLENNHTYNIAEIQIDGTDIEELTVNNWELLSPQAESPTIVLDVNGPSSSTSLDMLATTNLMARKSIGVAVQSKSNIVQSIAIGDTTVEVNDVSWMSVGQEIDLMDNENINTGRTIVAIDGNEIEFSPPINYAIGTKILKGGIVVNNNRRLAIRPNATTINLLIRDINRTANVVFFLQTMDGYFIEWSVSFVVEWESYNLYWIGETAILPISLFDMSGNPFPDGIRIDLVVDQKPDLMTKNDSSSYKVLLTSLAGTYKLYLSSTSSFSVNDIIDILTDNSQNQTSTINEIGIDGNGNYVKIDDALLFDVSVANGGRIMQNNNTNKTVGNNSASMLSSMLSMVDITPIYSGTSLDPSKLKPYDIAQVPPGTSYADLNENPQYLQKQIVDIPSVDGDGVIRILPITEDNLKNAKEKRIESNRYLQTDAKDVYISQSERNSGDIDSLSLVEPPATTVAVSGEYSIESPVYLLNGSTTSNMLSYATDLTPYEFSGVGLPNVDDTSLFAKKYDIYVSATLLSDNGATISKQYFDPFSIYFASPINFNSNRNMDAIAFYREYTRESDGCEQFAGYEKFYVDGVYASGNGFTIDYVVSDKFVLKKSGTINVTIYSNIKIDLESFADSTTSFSMQTINIQPPRQQITSDGETTIVQPLSDIDNWRQAVTSNSLSSVSVTNSFYTDSTQWQLATQYGQYEFEIPIVNGKATLTVPSSNDISLLMVEAVFVPYSGSTIEHISLNYVCVANPISVGGLNPWSIFPQQNQTYDISAFVEWMDGVDGIIDDNTMVSMEMETTLTEPSVSVTDNGWAGGIVVGPRSPIVYEPPDENTFLCPKEGEFEDVAIVVNHVSGYRYETTRKILWRGTTEDIVEESKFYFHAESDNGYAWADGDLSNATTFKVDLINDPLNLIWIDNDGRDRLMGFGQEDGLARTVYGFETTPSRQIFNNGVVEFTSKSLNKNIGYEQPYALGSNPPSPWNKLINMITSYRTANGSLRIGELATSLPVESVLKPSVQFAEPLGITVSLEGETFLRNGIDSPIVIADITWKNNPIRPFLTINEGTNSETIIQYPLPLVSFQSGICKRTNVRETTTPPSLMIDTRNIISGCYEVGYHQSGRLSSYSVQSGFHRTSIYDDGLGNRHSHVTEIDSNGNGLSTSTIVYEGIVASHTHTISNYQVDVQLAHSHSLRCVAITNILPTLDTETDLVVNAYVIYDPTNCEPYSGESSVPFANRMMFSTLYLNGYVIGKPTLDVTIETGSDLTNGNPFPDTTSSGNSIVEYVPTYYTARYVDDTGKGFDIRVHAEFSEYVTDVGGVPTTIPARNIDDGERIIVEVKAYKSENSTLDESGNEINEMVSAPGTKRTYMTLKVRALVASEGMVGGAEKTIEVFSINRWVPNVKYLLPNLTSDTIYIANAIDEIEEFGASQIHDAIRIASQRIIQFQTDNPSYKSYTKTIFLLTDGDENTSQYSINQAISNVSFIDGIDEVQVVPIKLGTIYGSDNVLMLKYASETNGFSFQCENYSNAELDSLIELMLSNRNWTMNYGTYRNRISFESPSILSTINLNHGMAPYGTSMEYRFRTSIDGISWNVWTSWMSLLNNYNFDQIAANKYKFMEYEVKLRGNSSFESPSLTAGAIVNYYRPQSFTVFFQPIYVDTKDDEYVGSIHLSHEADLPSTSAIEYGFVQNSSNDIDNYRNIYADVHNILPSRYNELLATTDYRTFRATNGRWVDGSMVRVYRSNISNPYGILVDSGEYSMNPANGEIVFNDRKDRNDVFVICIDIPSLFRFVCKITNYGEETAILHHVSLIYNFSKRIPVDSAGTIIHNSINSRIQI